MSCYVIVINNPTPEVYFKHTEEEAMKFAAEHGENCLSILAPDGREL